MKYLFSLLFLVAFCFTSEAQVITNFTGSDTIVNTATVNCDLIVRNAYTTGVFQVINTKVSGTPAGKTYFQASVDGTNYVNLDSITNVNKNVNTKVWTESPVKYPYYRFSSTGVSTMSVITAGKAHFKK